MKSELPPSSHPLGQRPILISSSDPEITSEPQSIDRHGEIIEDESEQTNPSTSEPLFDQSGAVWQGYFFASLPILACLFGAGRETWSKGGIAISAALILCFFSTTRKLPKLAALSLLGAVLAPLLAFLPMNWLSQSPAWRLSLEEDWGIELSSLVTPQVAVTLEAWLFFSLCCALLGWCITRGFSDQQRRAMIYTLTVGGILLCLLSIMEGAKWITIPWWPRSSDWGNGFGPFANRNHISSLAAMTNVLCAVAAHDAHNRKSRLWIFFVLGMAAPLICIFMNSSRAGLVLLFLGMTAWLATLAMRRGFFQKLATSISLICVIGTLLVISGGSLSKRLTTEGFDSFASGQGRIGIYVETLEMVSVSPWMGIGLGNFESIFPQFSSLDNPLSIYLHPESDLLWLLAEGGLLTFLPAGLLVLWIFLATGPWFGRKNKSRSAMQNRRLRNGSAIVFGIGTIHGLVDVPNHGLGYALFMCLLGGICIRPRRLPETAMMWQKITFRMVGVMILSLGIAWSAVSLGHPALAGTSAAEALKSRAVQLVSSGSPQDALQLLNAAIQMKPMDFSLYFERARVRLLLGQPAEDALTDFSRSRLLAPHVASLCLKEGIIWLEYKPALALVPWREVMRRWPGYNYWMMLQAADQHPELRQPLWNLAKTAKLKLEYLAHCNSKEEFEMCLRDLLAQDPALVTMESTQRESLFALWYERGNQATLISALEANLKWRDDGWRLLAEHYARNSEFQRACLIAAPYLPSLPRTISTTANDIPALERALLYNPTDARRGIDLFQTQKNQGDIDGALRTLEKVAALPKAPAYVRQEIAALYMLKQDYRRAWEQLREAMQKR